MTWKRLTRKTSRGSSDLGSASPLTSLKLRDVRELKKENQRHYKKNMRTAVEMELRCLSAPKAAQETTFQLGGQSSPRSMSPEWGVGLDALKNYVFLYQ
jgi:hypothetical protein